MKIDMHCHTKEGSLDGKVPIAKYIELLKKQGFGGMLVTDHDSYNGYRYWKKHLKGMDDFKVFKGIEYDTLDAGHIIVIMPNDVKLRLLELRGMPVQMLIPIVHNYGGILGPAHPFGEKFMSFMNAKAVKRNPDIVKEFDFIEVFNACESPESNERAKQLALKYNLSGTGGSDAHKEACIGLAYTVVADDIQNETQLIRFIKENRNTECGDRYYTHTTRKKLGHAKGIMAYSFWIYNKVGGLSRGLQRNGRMKKGYVEHVENADSENKTSVRDKYKK